MDNAESRSNVSAEPHCTVSWNVAECCTPPDVPVITTLNAPELLLVVRVKFWFAVPAEFVALKAIGNVPALVGVPPRTPPPEVLAVNVTPPGRAPLSVTVGVGVPVVVTLKEPAVPTVNVELFALVKAGT